MGYTCILEWPIRHLVMAIFSLLLCNSVWIWLQRDGIVLNVLYKSISHNNWKDDLINCNLIVRIYGLVILEVFWQFCQHFCYQIFQHDNRTTNRFIKAAFDLSIPHINLNYQNLFISIVAGVKWLCGGRKKYPRTSSLVQLYLLSGLSRS